MIRLLNEEIRDTLPEDLSWRKASMYGMLLANPARGIQFTVDTVGSDTGANVTIGSEMWIWPELMNKTEVKAVQQVCQDVWDQVLDTCVRENLTGTPQQAMRQVLSALKWNKAK